MTVVTLFFCCSIWAHPPKNTLWTYYVEDKWTFRGVAFGVPAFALPITLDISEVDILLGSFRSDRMGIFSPKKLIERIKGQAILIADPISYFY
jgi:hypothetical protein